MIQLGQFQKFLAMKYHTNLGCQLSSLKSKMQMQRQQTIMICAKFCCDQIDMKENINAHISMESEI